MSRASKLTLAATGLGTAGIVYFVHWAQEADRAVRTRAPSTIPELILMMNDVTGDAQGCGARYGEATCATRTTGRVRDAKTA